MATRHLSNFAGWCKEFVRKSPATLSRINPQQASLSSNKSRLRLPTATNMSSPTIKTRILIISDTHNAPLSSKEDGEPTAPFKSPLPSADLLIHCGDLTMTGELHEYHKTLDMLAEIDAPV
jgi:hypothetical protein